MWVPPPVPMFCPECGTLAFPTPSGDINCTNYKCGYQGPQNKEFANIQSSTKAEQPTTRKCEMRNNLPYRKHKTFKKIKEIWHYVIENIKLSLMKKLMHLFQTNLNNKKIQSDQQMVNLR